MKTKLLSLAARTGLFDILYRLSPGTLTVLNYHRIVDTAFGLDTFRPNISANPVQFTRQMEYVKRAYHVISVEDLLLWLRGEKHLPDHAAMITFDDGYLDNYLTAVPILQKLNLPATIFLTVDFIEKGRPFYWDRLAYGFHHSQLESVTLPGPGQSLLGDTRQREFLLANLVERLKVLQEEEKQKAVEAVEDSLKVDYQKMPRLSMTWEEVRTLAESGVDLGSHTLSHPILSRIPLAQGAIELSESRKIIEEKSGRPVVAFAYPNGHRADINDEVVKLARQSGYQCAFTLQPGPTRYRSVRNNPLLIRRIFISAKDTFEGFVAKIVGLPRLTYAFRSAKGRGSY